MAYEKKTWRNRQSEYPNRRRMALISSGIYEISREEGLVVEEGDPFDQNSMNGLENRVATAFGELTSGAVTVARATRATAADSADGVPWAGVSGKPATFAPATHSHTLTYNATIGTGWGGSGPWSQNVAVAGITAADTPWVDLVLSGTDPDDRARLEGWGMVSRITTYAGGITVRCLDDKPAVAMPIQMKVVR